MYITVLEKHDKTYYKIRVYRKELAETIVSDNMKLIAEHIRSIVRISAEKDVYLDDDELADCLRQIGVSHTTLKQENLKLWIGTYD